MSVLALFAWPVARRNTGDMRTKIDQDCECSGCTAAALFQVHTKTASGQVALDEALCSGHRNEAVDTAAISGGLTTVEVHPLGVHPDPADMLVRRRRKNTNVSHSLIHGASGQDLLMQAIETSNSCQRVVRAVQEADRGRAVAEDISDAVDEVLADAVRLRAVRDQLLRDR